MFAACPLHRRLAKLACLLVCLVASQAEARVDVSQANSGYLGRQPYPPTRQRPASAGLSGVSNAQQNHHSVLTQKFN